MNFGTFWGLRFTKFANIEPLKCQKTAKWELQEPSKGFHEKFRNLCAWNVIRHLYGKSWHRTRRLWIWLLTFQKIVKWTVFHGVFVANGTAKWWFLRIIAMFPFWRLQTSWVLTFPCPAFLLLDPALESICSFWWCRPNSCQFFPSFWILELELKSNDEMAVNFFPWRSKREFVYLFSNCVYFEVETKTDRILSQSWDPLLWIL